METYLSNLTVRPACEVFIVAKFADPVALLLHRVLLICLASMSGQGVDRSAMTQPAAPKTMGSLAREPTSKQHNFVQLLSVLVS